jgi:hypothetical protein
MVPEPMKFDLSLVRRVLWGAVVSLDVFVRMANAGSRLIWELRRS